MSVQIKQLGSGTIAAAGSADLGTTVASGKTRIVKSIRLVNAAASAPAYINMQLIKVDSNGNALQTINISPVNLYLVSGGMYVDETEITMEQDYKIKIVLSAGSGGPLHYTVSGIERDV